MDNLNTQILNVPLGFIRLLELPLVIIAFASAANYGSQVCYSGKCNSNVTVEPQCFKFGYPFHLTDIEISGDSCILGTAKTTLFHEDHISSAQFFVFVGVISMVYILAMLYIYMTNIELYETDSRLPQLDLVVTSILALFWFAGSIAFGALVTAVRQATGQFVILGLLNDSHPKHGDLMCVSPNGPCVVDDHAAYGGIVVATIAGFGCFFVFSGNIWFVLKETSWFKQRSPQGMYADPSPDDHQPLP